MTKMVVRLPKGFEEKVREATEKADMLPTELIREVLRARCP